VFVREGSTVLRDVAIIILGIGILLTALIGCAVVLAMVSDEPNWSEITLAIATVVLAAATLGLATAAFLALASIGEAKRSLDEARNARNAVQMTELSRRWDEEKNQDVRLLVRAFAQGTVAYFIPAEPPEPDDLREPDRLKEAILTLKRENHPDYRKLITDPNFLEDVAIMINYGGIDIDIVRESLGWHFAYRWSLWKPTVVALRIADNVAETYENLEELAKRMAAYYPKSFTFNAQGEIVWTGIRD
jgi:hypothetical protein